MAEKIIIDGIHVTNSDIKCPGCGATNITFDPATTTLSCPFCGVSALLPTPETGAVAEELDFNSAMQRASVDWGRYKKLVVCSNCGGETIYDAEKITGSCPFCGSTHVTTAETAQIMAPNAVIPFAFGKEKLQDLFIAELKKRAMLNKKALNCKLENVTGIYLPFWTFDTYTASSYTAVIPKGHGRADYEKRNWYQFIDDIVVFASVKIRHPFIKNVQEFDFTKAVPYSPEYLAGIPAERYTRGLNDGWNRAQLYISDKLKTTINRSDRRRSYARDIATNYYNVKFRYLLAPIYLATYTFGKKTYQVAINGQTGKTVCPVPTTVGKLVRLILLFMLAVAIIMVITVILMINFL